VRCDTLQDVPPLLISFSPPFASIVSQFLARLRAGHCPDFTFVRGFFPSTVGTIRGPFLRARPRSVGVPSTFPSSFYSQTGSLSFLPTSVFESLIPFEQRLRRMAGRVLVYAKQPRAPAFALSASKTVGRFFLLGSLSFVSLLASRRLAGLSLDSALFVKIPDASLAREIIQLVRAPRVKGRGTQPVYVLLPPPF